MDDLLKRLRKIETGDGAGDHVTHWYRNPDGVEAAEEIVKLKWRAKIDANIIARLRLTDSELEAVKQAIGIVDWHKAYFSRLHKDEPLPSATLRKLLERIK